MKKKFIPILLSLLVCISFVPIYAAQPFNQNTTIQAVKNNEMFDDYGRLMFPVQEDYYSGKTLGDLQLTWYNNIQPEKTVEITNYFYQQASGGNVIFYDIYSDEEKKEDPDKKDTGLFFFRGDPNAKTAIVNAGGGFAYVGAMQDSFPVALELSKKGYNAFALIYRPDEQTAYEDLAKAIAFLEENASSLQIDMTDYSLWGGSAGARMANAVGTNGTAAYGQAAYPKPAMVVTQYTGLSEVTGDEPPTYANVGTDDSIADASVMRRRIRKIKKNGTDAKIEVFKGLQHGFGLGQGTVAEGWVDHAISFWKKQMKTSVSKKIRSIPSAYRQTTQEQGTLVDLHYDTWESFDYDQQKTRLTKHAIVYLPSGYDANQAYDIFYLMHGGWSNENTTLGTPENPSTFKNVLDHMIQEGDIKPLIVVCPTYNNTSEEDSSDFSLARQLTNQYHNELVNDLIPTVESTYHTYAQDTTPEAIEASRDHRGFGGFSMGSVATWHTFQYALDDFRYFLLMSCGTDLDMEPMIQAAKKRRPSDYLVFMMTGTKDFAYAYDKERHTQLLKTAAFNRNNLVYRIKKGYAHTSKAAQTYTYNGLLTFYKK